MRASIALFLLLCTSSGCSSETRKEDVEDVELPAYLLANSIWSSTTIPVCWEPHSDGGATSDDEAKAWVRNAVENTWEAFSELRFTGWGTCSWSSMGIRIADVDEGPHVQELGSKLDGMPSGMVLNFTFHDWGEGCQDDRENCIRKIAVHEFGHAIGFAHEHNRPDTPSSCTADEQGTDGDVMIGDWDEQSVMNYCNPKWNGDGKLSAGDIRAVELAYGATIWRGMQVVNRATGKCLDVSDVSVENGANVHSWSCHDGLNQKWDFIPLGLESYQVVSRRSLACLDVAAFGKEDGSNVQQWSCSDGTNQHWRLVSVDGDGYLLRAEHSDKCLDLAAGDSKDGTNVLTWGCHEGDNQVWTLH